MPVLTAEQLKRIARALFGAAGASSDEAEIVANHLVDANLAGHDSHGVLRIPQYLKAIQSGDLKVNVEPRVLLETPATAVLDGRGGFGQLVGRNAMNLAMQKARQTGISAVAARNSYHTGRIASYPLMAAAEEMVAIVMVNAGGGGQSVAPFGGLGRRLATNPLSIAAPSGGEFPVLLDIATSVAPEGKIRDRHLKDKPVPLGWLIDSQGRPSTDPKDFYGPPAGALLPLGGAAGYKGFGLAFMIDILAGALSGAGCCRPEVLDARDGALMIVIDVKRFIPMESFYRQVTSLAEYVRTTPLAPGSPGILVPGELEYRSQQRRSVDGIEVDEATWQEVEALGALLGVSTSRFAQQPASEPLNPRMSKAI